MNYLGIDYGIRRIGLAYSGELRIATPYAPIMNDNENSSIEKIIHVINQEKIEKIVMGFPQSLNGKKGEMCELIENFTNKLKE
jgi:putative Holliday junction resolvase